MTSSLALGLAMLACGVGALLLSIWMYGWPEMRDWLQRYPTLRGWPWPVALVEIVVGLSIVALFIWGVGKLVHRVWG